MHYIDQLNHKRATPNLIEIRVLGWIHFNNFLGLEGRGLAEGVVGAGASLVTPLAGGAVVDQAVLAGAGLGGLAGGKVLLAWQERSVLKRRKEPLKKSSETFWKAFKVWVAIYRIAW